MRRLVAIYTLHLMVATGYAVSWRFGVPQEVFDRDLTYLSSVIALIYVICALVGLGRAFRNVDSKSYDDHSAYHFSDVCLNLGLLGTVIGFGLMLKSIISLDPSDVPAVRAALGDIAAGMATALYTTGVGLVAKVLLMTQHYISELGPHLQGD